MLDESNKTIATLVKIRETNMKRRSFLQIGLSFILLGCRYPQKDKKSMDDLLKTMTTRGIGRYLFDLPASFGFISAPVTDLDAGINLTLYYGTGRDPIEVVVSVQKTGVSYAQFQSIVFECKAVIEKKTNSYTDKPIFKRMDRLQNGAVLLVASDPELGDAYLTYYLLSLIGGTMVVCRAKSYEGNYLPVEKRIKELSTKLSPVTNINNAPAGTIIGDVIITGSDHDQENLGLEYSGAPYPALIIEVRMNSNARPTDTSARLCEQTARKISQSPDLSAKFHTIRTEKFKFAGMDAEQVIVTANIEAEKFSNYKAETYIDQATLMKPSIVVEMTIDGAPNERKPELSPIVPVEMGTQLWDVILRSFRPRPGAV